MGESSRTFSMRIVSIDYYMSPPIPGFDICYSSFQGGKVNEVPVIRIYGSTPSGQKTCLHIHRAFPYLYVPCSDMPCNQHKKGDAFANALFTALEKALKLKGSSGSRRQHIHGCSLVHAKKLYGYHSLEELFVKIYFYNPHDVSRAAKLLLGGSVLDKSLQPYESHIPFILQFLVDYNLYGMGQIHLSKMKFRPPVPDFFTTKNIHQIGLLAPGLSCAETSASQVWILSSIPDDWIWKYHGELESQEQDIGSVKRQSVCELEGDAIVNEILNQQFITYMRLSQTESDVKMVQSLVPIWEEEYERTGMHEGATLPDPGRPDPRDVLKTLSSDLKFEEKFTELFCSRELNNSSIATPENILLPVVHSTDDEILVNTGNTDSNANGETLRPCTEQKVILFPPEQGSHLDTVAVPVKSKNGSPKLSPDSSIQSPAIIGSLGQEDPDAEALGLLRWLANSQAGEDITDDDELVRETILSPFLPSITIEKVLEKANADYENESQKECQDILDSVDDLVNYEDLNERSSSVEKVLQFDAALHTFPPELTGNSPKTNMKCESVRYSVQENLYRKDTNFSSKHKKKKTMWGPLPFSVTRKVNDNLQVDQSNLPDLLIESKRSGGGCVIRNENEKCNSPLVKNMETSVCEPDALVGCSMQDLMRRKRCHPTGQSDDESNGAKRIHSGIEDKENSVHPLNHLDSSIKLPKPPVSEPICSDCHAPMTNSASAGVSSLEYSACPLSVVTRDYMKERDSAAAVSHHESTIRRGFNCRATSEAIISNASSDQDDIVLAGKRLSLMEAAWLTCGPVSSAENPKRKTDGLKNTSDCGSQDSFRKSSEILNVDLMSMNLMTGPTVVHDKDGSPAQQGYSGIIEEPVDSVAMTFYENPPPPADWKYGKSNDTLFRPSLSCHFVEETKDGISDNALDEVRPFFEEGPSEDKSNPLINSKRNGSQEAIMGVPTHYQNDGSLLYLLTRVISPPSVDCVRKWLLPDNRGSNEVESQAYSPIDESWMMDKSCSESELVVCMDQGKGDINRDLVKELQACHDESQRTVQSEEKNEKLNAAIDCSVDLSQISGPDGKSRPTPLSQMGFRDPASIGAGQQLTLLSVEVQAESRGDLRADPRFDPINIICLAFQNDNDPATEVYVLLHGTDELHHSFDGISGCKFVVLPDEKQLFGHFKKIIGSFDPDVIMGWDVQSGSLGFLAERAAHLGIGLLDKISRTPFEADMTGRERGVSEGEAMDSYLNELSVEHSALVEDVLILDEWGRTHASGVHVSGRVVLNLWRLMRGEVKLNIYTVEAVCEAVLRRKIPSIPCRTLIKWYSSGPGRARYRCVQYVLQRAKVNLEIMNQLDMINRTSELARVFGIDFFSVLSRGSQYRVESMLLRLAHTQNYLAISPGNQQVASQPAMECLPLVMEPESGFYADPVVVLDFQSLYPSMIIAYNLCFSTCLGNVAPSKANTLGVSSFSPDSHVLRDLKDEILLTPNQVMYVPSKVRKGILPRLLDEILSTRIMVKQAMKKLTPSQKVLQRIFNARQLALKLIANVTYGYTAAGFSGRMPCAELADSIVQCGRSTLEKAISLVNENSKWKAKVIYGDTDSMFVLLKERTVKEAFQIGKEIASAVTAMNPNPVTLKLEKVYHPCFLFTKKRYVGYSYESADQIEPLFDAKGIETVRRDSCGAVAKIMEQSLRLFFEYQDICKVKAYVQRQWTRILSGRVSLEDFVFAKEVRLGTYSARNSALPPAAIVATKAMRIDPRAEPRYAERVPYVVIHGEPGARLVDMVVDPFELLAIDSPYRLNDAYYINKQIIPALQRVFRLVGVDLNRWFSEMPRPFKDSFAKRPLHDLNVQRTRIDYYYLSTHCVLCGELVNALTHLCNNCQQNEAASVTAVVGRTSKLEREMVHLVSICQHCGGGDWLVESGIKCTSLACSVFYERCKVQKELQGFSAIASGKGLYPKCAAEWF